MLIIYAILYLLNFYKSFEALFIYIFFILVAFIMFLGSICDEIGDSETFVGYFPIFFLSIFKASNKYQKV